MIDALAAVQMLVPGLMGTMLRQPDFRPDADYRYAMGMGASLMLGWTVLLLWADRKPVERKGVLLITVVPVILGMALNEIWGVRAQFIAQGAMIPVWGLQAGLAGLFTFSYFNSPEIPVPQP